ncbi:hypothetical protein [Tateyamaria sp.]|uniref:hypothetical protein n=1 Tax=Tateyamaria sp. TaxID=1929288 RepID=UPI00329DC06D
MPFDMMTPSPPRPERHEIDPDDVARKVHDFLGRPLTRDEYAKCWNSVIDAGWGGTRERIDYWQDVS